MRHCIVLIQKYVNVILENSVSEKVVIANNSHYNILNGL